MERFWKLGALERREEWVLVVAALMIPMTTLPTMIF